MTTPAHAMEAACKRGVAGIHSSVEHADENAPGWSERAYHFMVAFAASELTPWTVERFREWAMAQGLDKPAEERAYGAVTQRALRNGVMVRVGFAPAASSNCGAKPLYAQRGVNE